MDTYLILFYPWTPHKYWRSWPYFKDEALFANYRVYSRQWSQCREQGSLRIFGRCQNILEASVMKALFKMSRLCPMVGDAPAHIFRCVLLWPVETGLGWKKILSPNMKDYLWILKNKTCGLKNQATAHYCYWVIQKHVLENYIQHDKSLQLLWKASKKESYKNTFKKLPVILGL